MSYFISFSPAPQSGYTAMGIAPTEDLGGYIQKAVDNRCEGLVFTALPGSPTFPIFAVRNRHRPLSRLGTSFLLALGTVGGALSQQ